MTVTVHMLRLPHFVGAERGSRVLQFFVYQSCNRVRATEHAPREQ